MATPPPTNRRDATGGRRHDDGHVTVVQKINDHQVALMILTLLSRILLGCVILGGLLIMKQAVVPFAGKTTNIQAAISISVAIAFSMGAAWGYRELKFRDQRKQIQRLRVQLETKRNKNSQIKAMNARRGK